MGRPDPSWSGPGLPNPRVKRTQGLLLVALVACLAACGGNGGGSGTTSTGVTVDENTITVVSTTAATLSDLTGVWDNGVLVLEVNDSGEYVVMSSDGSTTVLMGGFVARDGDEFSFVTATTAECPGQTGTYVAVVEGDELTLTLVEDPCALRSSGFAAPFARND